MARWIAFDQQTSSLLRSKLLRLNPAQGTQVETFGRGAIDYALAKPGAVVTLLPAAGGLDIGIAVFRRPKKRIARVAPAQTGKDAPVHVASVPVASVPLARVAPPHLPPRGAITRAGGFLGLSDESVIEDESMEEKKGWWRRLWE
jgi:hypothetical protein